MRKRRRTVDYRGGTVIALSVMVLVAGCHSSKTHGAAPSTSTNPSTNAAASASVQASAGGSSVAASSAASSQVPAAATVAVVPSNPNSFGPPVAAQMGTTVAYPDGLAVALLSATTFTPDAAAQGMDVGDTAVQLQVRITNGSKAAFDASAVQVEAFAGANVDQAGPITESTPSGPAPIAAGQSATLTFDFAVQTADLPNISVTVTPNATEADATFTGQVTG